MNKESTERSQLVSFLGNMGIHLSPQQIIKGDGSPDLIVKTPTNCKIAFELTELFMDKQGKYSSGELEAAENKILQQTRIGIERIKLPFMEVKVSFRRTPYPKNGYDIDHIVDSLVRLIRAKVQNKTHDFKPIIIENPGIDGISMVYIKSATYKGTQWLSSHRILKIDTHWVKRNPLKEIEKSIGRKEKGLNKYKNGFDRSCLLLVFNRTRWTQAFEVDSLRNSIDKSNFDGVFLHDYGLKSSIELTSGKPGLQELIT